MWSRLLLILMSFYSAPTVEGIVVLAQGTVVKERIDALFLQCDVTNNLGQEEEHISATWCHFDHYHQCADIFRVDLTSDNPAYFFASAWIGRGQYDTSSTANIVLPSHYITRNLAGTYRCTVRTTLSTAFADVQVNVLYGPGTSISIEPSGRVERTEKEELSLTCEANCRPACSYRWYMAGQRVASTSILRMTSLHRGQAGLYACQARNEAGRSIKPVEVRISYQAAILSLNMSTSATVPMVADDTGKVPKTDLKLSCMVQGWPTPKATWLRGYESVVTGNRSDIVATSSRHNDDHVFHLEFTSASCLDNGNYSCRVWNGVGSQKTKTISIKLSCGPVDLKANEICQSHDNEQTDENKNIQFVPKWDEHVTFHLCFWAFPKARVFFRRKHTRNIYEAEVICLNTTNACTSSLKFQITSGDQYGVYEAEVTNGLYSLIKMYTLISKQPPRPPEIQSVNDVTSSSACVTWKSGFDGGAPQKFTLSYNYDFNGLGWLEKLNNLNLEINQTEGDNSSFHHKTCLHNLVPASLYTLLMTAQNQYGTSNSSKEFVFKTLHIQLSSASLTILNTGISSTQKPRLFMPSTSTVSGPLDKSTGNSHGRNARIPSDFLLDYTFDDIGKDDDNSRNDYRGRLEAMAINEDDDDFTDFHNHHDVDDDGDDDDTEERNLIHSLFLYLNIIFQNSSTFRDNGDTVSDAKPFFNSQPLHVDRYLRQYTNLKIESHYANITNTSNALDSIGTRTNENTISPFTVSNPVTDFGQGRGTMMSFTTAVVFVTIGSLIGVIFGITIVTLLVRRCFYDVNQVQSKANGRSSKLKSLRPFRSYPDGFDREQSTTLHHEHQSTLAITTDRNGSRMSTIAPDKHFAYPDNACGISSSSNRNTPASFRARLSTPDLNFIKSKPFRSYPDGFDREQSTTLHHEHQSTLAITTDRNGSRMSTIAPDKHFAYPDNACGISSSSNRNTPASFRARLSTPDLNFIKSKRKRAPPPSPPPFQTDQIGKLMIPTISVNDVRMSSSANFDTGSSISSGSSGLHNRAFDYLSPSTTLERNKHSSYSSIPQEIGTANSNSYLDLYEMIGNRSRSRSPSNIYDPLDCPTLRREKHSKEDQEETNLKQRAKLQNDSNHRKDQLSRSASQHTNYCNDKKYSYTQQFGSQQIKSTMDFKVDPNYSHYEECVSLIAGNPRLSKVADKRLSVCSMPNDEMDHCTESELKPRLTCLNNTNDSRTDPSVLASGDQGLVTETQREISTPRLMTFSDETGFLPAVADHRNPNPNKGIYISLRESTSKIDDITSEDPMDGCRSDNKYVNGTEADNDTSIGEYDQVLQTTSPQKGHSPLVLRVSSNSQDGCPHHKLPIRVILDQERDGQDLVVSGYTQRRQIFELSRKASDSEHYIDIDADAIECERENNNSRSESSKPKG